MLDMGQADRTLRFTPSPEDRRIPWTAALIRAARQMGYEHWTDVLCSEVGELKRRAKQIQGASSC